MARGSRAVPVIDLPGLLVLGQAISGPAALALVWIVWRIDHRLTKLETTICFILKHNGGAQNGK